MKRGKILAGVDEAGRGSVLGPLLIAGVSISESKIPRLVELGVKDSKLLTPERRRFLYRKIKQIADQVSYQKIEPAAIDEVVLKGGRLLKLNRLEAEHSAVLLSKLKYDTAYVDACDVNESRYGRLIADLIFERLSKQKNSQFKKLSLGEANPFWEKIKSEHHADRNYPVVSAASIIAKVTRDSCISRLHRVHGVFGSGYPSDPATISFLKGFLERSETFPPITRLSWFTINRLAGEQRPPAIEDFAKRI